MDGRVCSLLLRFRGCCAGGEPVVRGILWVGCERARSATVLQWMVEVFHFNIVELEVAIRFLVRVESESDWVHLCRPLQATRTMSVCDEVGLLRGTGRVGCGAELSPEPDRGSSACESSVIIGPSLVSRWMQGRGWA